MGSRSCSAEVKFKHANIKAPERKCIVLIVALFIGLLMSAVICWFNHQKTTAKALVTAAVVLALFVIAGASIGTSSNSGHTEVINVSP